MSPAGETTPRLDWEWAELDRRRLVWAERGCLYAASLASRDAIGEPMLLHDFDAYTFEAIEAPYE